MREIQLGDMITDQFPVFQADRVTKQTGETVFTTTLWKDGVVQTPTPSVSIVEIGSSGEYKVTFTPDTEGFWELEIDPDYNDDLWSGQYDVIARLRFNSTMADNGTNAEFCVWAERNGQRLTNLTQMTATIKDGQDNTVVSLGADSSDTSDGIFRWTTATSNLETDISYVLAITATDGDDTYNANLGFVKVS